MKKSKFMNLDFSSIKVLSKKEQEEIRGGYGEPGGWWCGPKYYYTWSACTQACGMGVPAGNCLKS